MANSLLTGVTGLRVHQQMLDVVGNNLANTNTPGFKSQRVRFSDLFYQSAGINVNPMQIGLGAGLAGIDTNFQQGNLETTGNDLDVALSGGGFFVLQGAQQLYTRVGAFGISNDNRLIDLGSGFEVQRVGNLGEGNSTTPAFQTTGDKGIRIPAGTVLPGQVTSQITFQGNLSAQATGPQAETLTSTAPYKSGGVAATAATLLNALDDNLAPYATGDSIRIQGTDRDGSTINTTVAVDATTTLGDVVNAVDAAFPQSTASLDANGNLVLKADTTGPTFLSLSLTDEPGNAGRSNFASHPMLSTTKGKDGDTVTSGIQIFDAQGTAHNVSLVFTKQAQNIWDLSASMATADGTMIDGSVQGITFADDGSFLGVSGAGAGDPFITFQINGLSTPQTVALSFGTPGQFDALTQFGTPSFASATKQDGFAPGTLARLSIDDTGVLNGVFSNGRVLPIAQFAIASFANIEGLSREGNNLYSITSSSGPALIGTARTDNRGSVKQGVLEGSNVDVALEFTRLIIAQRGFSVNARTVTVANEVLGELSNIIR